MNLNSLISQAQVLEVLASTMQPEDKSNLTEDEIQKLRNEYNDWYTSCLSILTDDLEKRFRVEYQGSLMSPKIRQFLESPNKPNPLAGKEGSWLVPYWLHPYERVFRSHIHIQKQILIEAKKQLKVQDVSNDAITTIETLARKFPTIAQQLKSRYNGRPTITITDEYDVQDLFHALLRMFFDDVRAEDSTERYGAKNYRIDFVLKQEETVVEIKMTRPNLNGKKIQDQLAIDIDAYRKHSSCKNLVAFIYDPERYIENPVGFEIDVSGPRQGMTVKVIVVQG